MDHGDKKRRQKVFFIRRGGKVIPIKVDPNKGRGNRKNRGRDAAIAGGVLLAGAGMSYASSRGIRAYTAKLNKEIKEIKDKVGTRADYLHRWHEVNLKKRSFRKRQYVRYPKDLDLSVKQYYQKRGGYAINYRPPKKFGVGDRIGLTKKIKEQQARATLLRRRKKFIGRYSPIAAGMVASFGADILARTAINSENIWIEEAASRPLAWAAYFGTAKISDIMAGNKKTGAKFLGKQFKKSKTYTKLTGIRSKFNKAKGFIKQAARIIR